jgi:CTP:molybdopterin cytidylyltransferase MocA
VILAAGASRRLGQPKQLLKLGGEFLIEHAIRLANEAGAKPVILVLGAHSDSIRPFIALNGAIEIFNDQWEQGIASSIRAGIHGLEIRERDEPADAAPGVLILSCDQPRLTAAHLRALIETFSARSEPVIVASTYAGVQGVPAVFPRCAFTDLVALQGDKGARALLVEPPCPVIGIPFDGGEVDIDHPGDMAELE